MNGRGLHNYLHSDDLVFLGIFQAFFSQELWLSHFIIIESDGYF